MGEEESNLVKHWRKEILLAASLLAVFAGAVAVGTVPDTQEATTEQYQQLLDKTEQLEADIAKQRGEIDKLSASHEFANAVSEDLSDRLARVEGRY